MPQATGGTGATSAFNNQVVTLLSQTTSVVPQVEVTYVSSSEGSGGTQVTTRTTISGSQTPTLTLNVFVVTLLIDKKVSAAGSVARGYLCSVA